LYTFPLPLKNAPVDNPDLSEASYFLKLVGREVVETADFTLPNPQRFPVHNDLPVLKGAAAFFAIILLK